MERETRRFKAVADDGTEVVVIEYRWIDVDRDLSGTTSIRKRLPEIRLADGSRVTPIDPETFKIVQTDQIIRKVR